MADAKPGARGEHAADGNLFPDLAVIAHLKMSGIDGSECADAASLADDAGSAGADKCKWCNLRAIAQLNNGAFNITEHAK